MNKLIKLWPQMNPVFWVLGLLLAIAVAFLIGLLVVMARYRYSDFNDQDLRASKVSKVLEVFVDRQDIGLANDDVAQLPQISAQPEFSKAETPEVQAPELQAPEVQPPSIDPQIADEPLNPYTPNSAPAIQPNNQLELNSYNVAVLEKTPPPRVQMSSNPVVPPDNAQALVSPRQTQFIGLSQQDFPFKALKPFKTDPRIARHVLTYDLKGQNPGANLAANVKIDTREPTRLFWFNEIVDAKGEMFYQSWYYQGLLMSRMAIDVKSDQWKASSYKTILPQQQGEWRVATETLDEQVLSEQSFRVTL